MSNYSTAMTWACYIQYIYIYTHTVFFGHLVEIQILQTIWEAPSNILKLFIWAKIYTCLFQSKQKGYVPLFVVWNWATDSNTLVSLGSMVKRVNSMSVSQRNIAINSFLYLYIYIYRSKPKKIEQVDYMWLYIYIYPHIYITVTSIDNIEYTHTQVVYSYIYSLITLKKKKTVGLPRWSTGLVANVSARYSLVKNVPKTCAKIMYIYIYYIIYIYIIYIYIIYIL